LKKLRLKSIGLFDEEVNEESVRASRALSKSLDSVITAIDEERNWAIRFYDLPLEERKTAYLYAYQKSLERKKELVRLFRGFKPADIFANIFNVSLKSKKEVDVILFEDHIHFILELSLKQRFKVKKGEGRIITALLDDENLTDYGRYFEGTVSIVNKNYSNHEEAAYHERYHGLTYDMPLQRLADIIARYWKRVGKARLKPDNGNITDFLIKESVIAHMEANAIYHTSKGLDEDRFLSAYYIPSMFQILGVFFPEYLCRTIKGGPPSRLVGELVKIYRNYVNILGRTNTNSNKKVQMYLELLRFDELEKLPELVNDKVLA
jgi:hypothetical protein